MKSPNELIQKMEDYAYRKMRLFVNSGYDHHLYFQTYFELFQLFQNSAQTEYLIGLLIEKSQSDKLAFQTLRYAAAHYEKHSLEKPIVIRDWLVDFLEGRRTEPKTGQTKLKRENQRDFLIYHMAKWIELNSCLPLYFDETSPNKLTVMSIIATASKRLESLSRKRSFPTTPRKIQDRFSIYKRNNFDF